MRKLVVILAVTSLVFTIFLSFMATVRFDYYKEKAKENTPENIALAKDQLVKLKEMYNSTKGADGQGSKDIEENITKAEKAIAEAEQFAPGKFSTLSMIAYLIIAVAIGTAVTVFLKNPMLTMGAGGLLIVLGIVLRLMAPFKEKGMFEGAVPQQVALMVLIPAVLGGALAILAKRMTPKSITN